VEFYVALPVGVQVGEETIKSSAGSDIVTEIETVRQGTVRTYYVNYADDTGTHPTLLRLIYKVTIEPFRLDLASPDKNDPPHPSDLDTTALTYSLPRNYVSFAHALAARYDNPFAITKAFYDWTVNNIEYSYPPPSWKASGVLKTMQGDCFGQAALVIAFCREVGIPARMVMGWYDVGDEGYHCWGEVYLEALGWIPVDPSFGQDAGTVGIVAAGEQPLEQSNAEYYFGNLDDLHLPFLKGLHELPLPIDEEWMQPTGGYVFMTDGSGHPLPFGIGECRVTAEP